MLRIKLPHYIYGQIAAEALLSPRTVERVYSADPVCSAVTRLRVSRAAEVLGAPSPPAPTEAP
jgi:DNA-binding LacI/PurR family transcriptional regulator